MSSFIYINMFGLTKITYSIVYGTLAIGYLVGNYFMRKLNDKSFHINNLIYIGAVISFIGSLILLVIPISENYIFTGSVICISFFIMRLGFGFISSPIQIGTINIYKEISGQALGFVTFYSFVASSIVSYWVSLYQNNPITGVIIVSLILNVIIFISFLTLFFLFKNNAKIKKNE